MPNRPTFGSTQASSLAGDASKPGAAPLRTLPERWECRVTDDSDRILRLAHSPNRLAGISLAVVTGGWIVLLRALVGTVSPIEWNPHRAMAAALVLGLAAVGSAVSTWWMFGSTTWRVTATALFAHRSLFGFRWSQRYPHPRFSMHQRGGRGSPRTWLLLVRSQASLFTPLPAFVDLDTDRSRLELVARSLTPGQHPSEQGATQA